tara:strand:+ start:959 stop:1396 length:438 start_codon:yes stop_codon:yes gene_type:complete
MSFTHTNKVRYEYTAAGTTEAKQTEGSETGSGEANVSETWILSSSPLTVQNISFFNLEAKGQVLSTFLMVEGCNGTLVDASDGAVATLVNGIPQVYSKGGGTAFPVGSTNPMNDSMVGLKFTPSGSLAIENASVTLTVRVLFDAS